MKQDGSGGGTTVSVTPGTIARMAGNIAAGLVAVPAYRDDEGLVRIMTIARISVAIAQEIVDQLNQQAQS